MNLANYKCANCGGVHASNSVDCEVYKGILERKNANTYRNERSSTRSGVSNSNNNNKDQHVPVSRGQTRRGYSQAVRGSPGDVNTADQEKNINIEENTNSFNSIFSDIKSIFLNFNLRKIGKICSKIAGNLRKSRDSFEKITCIIEGILEIFE